MKKGLFKKVLGTAMVVTMTTSMLAGCGGGTASTSETAGASSGGEESNVESSDGTVTLTLLATKISSNVTDYPDTHVIQEMADKIGVKINIIEADTDKYNVYLASGEGFDMILTPTTNFKQLIDGNVVVPMDDLITQYGSDIIANIPDTVEFSKSAWSEGKDQVYFLPCQIGIDSVGSYQQQGPVTRWEYYSELGYPETSNVDEWLQMLSDMKNAHPETEDGLPVYGVSMFADWGIWCYKYPLACYLGYNELSGSKTGMYKPAAMEYSNLFADDGLYWESINYYYKANQLGILDPDAFITNYDDFSAKATNGQLLTAPTTWATGDYNATHSDKAAGYVVIPTSWANQWGGTDYKAGWVDKCFGISANSKYPEKCMEYLNYVYSYEGARELYSGVEGVDYTIENGVPTLTKESVDLFVNGGEAWKESGLNFDRNIVGLGDYTINPADGKTLNLFYDPSLYPELLNTCLKDYSAHYGVEYPEQIMEQYMKEYNLTDQNKTDAFTVALVSSAPDDITRIEANLIEAATAASSKIILAADDAEFEQLKQQTMEEFASIGLQDVIDWYSTEWTNAQEKAASFK